jgi:hypothetical protein
VQKLKTNNDISEDLKVAIDPVYKQTVQHLETAAVLEKEAKEVLKKNISVQEENYKTKLAARKERLRQKRSMMSGDSDSFLSGLQHP